ncbi:MAG: DUF6527 family protein [Candidatus Binataceae bacterium]
MKLIELDPRWTASSPDRSGVGMTFDCPFHHDGHEPLRVGCRIGVRFKNPVDGGAPYHEGPLWERQGDTFETLTLKPSIAATGCWHGFITNGEVVNA